MSYQFIRRADHFYPITPDAIRNAHKANVSFGPTVTPEVADALGYDVVTHDAQPAYNETTQIITALDPLFSNGAWTQGWTVTDKSPEQIAAEARDMVPIAVTMRQARLAMLGAGVLSAANDAIAAMEGVQGDAARIEWEYAQEVRRDAPLVAGMAAALGLSETQIDGLFVAAAGL